MPSPELSALIERALSNGIEQVQSARKLKHPYFLDEAGVIQRLAGTRGADPMALALKAIREKAPGIQRCVLVMGTRITTKDRNRWDAILAIGCDREAEQGEAWAQRYARRIPFRPFRAEPPELVGKAKNFIRTALGAEATTPDITFRLMEAADLPMIHEWVKRPHVREWWAGEEASMPFEDFRALYLPRAMAQEQVTPYIAMLGGRPLGYAQSYVAMGSGGGWWDDIRDPGVRGIDQFLGEASDLGQGLGTRMVRAFVARLFADAAVTRIQTDPDPRNLRAVRCYEKAGFRTERTIETPDGAALYMIQDRPEA